MQKITDAITRNLIGIDQGHLVTVVITQATSNCVLEFKHAGDTWRVHPGVSGVASSGVIIMEFRCISAEMRVRFLTQPTQNYYISLVQAAQSTF